MNVFERHLNNIPHLIEEKRDVDRYLRAFSSMVEALDEQEGTECATDTALEAMRDAISFISDDAFRRGFEDCHENIVLPLRGNTIPREAAPDEMRRHGELVRQAIVAKFEESPGVPNQLTVDIDEVELPEPKIRVAQ